MNQWENNKDIKVSVLPTINKLLQNISDSMLDISTSPVQSDISSPESSQPASPQQSQSTQPSTSTTQPSTSIFLNAGQNVNKRKRAQVTFTPSTEIASSHLAHPKSRGRAKATTSQPAKKPKLNFSEQQERTFINSVATTESAQLLSTNPNFKIDEEELQLLTQWSPEQCYFYEQMLSRNFIFTDFFTEDAIETLKNNYTLFKPQLKCIQCNHDSALRTKTCCNCYNIVCSTCFQKSKKTTNFTCNNC